jgi:hypothetical protein
LAAHNRWFPVDADPHCLQTIRQIPITTIDTVPKRLRKLTAQSLVGLLRQVNSDPQNLNNHAQLNMFAKCVLKKVHHEHPTRKEAAKIQMNTTRDALKRWQTAQGKAELWEQLQSDQHSRNRTVADQTAKNIKRCKYLVRKGRLSDGLKALTSSGVLRVDGEVLTSLQQLHPQTPPSNYNLHADDLPLQIESPSVLKQLKRFPKGTSCGADGLRAQHLLDCLLVPELYYDVSEALTLFVNIALSGRFPQSVATWYASAPLTALPKPHGGVRPIAVGEIFRRLISKCAMSEISSQAASVLAPLQLGVGIRNGAESIVHSINRLVELYGSDNNRAMVKIDFGNAFNSVARLPIFESVKSNFPSLLPWIKSCYIGTPALFADSHIIWSCTGVQQGVLFFFLSNSANNRRPPPIVY